MRKILALVLLTLLSLPAISWGASADSITIHVNGTESILTMEPEVVKEYVPAVMSGDEEISPEEIGEVMFPALSGTNYTFETVPNALDFTISARSYILDRYRGRYYNDPSYDITFDPMFPEAAGRPISTTAEYAIETGNIASTVDLSDYGAISDITFTASPRSITAPYGSRHFAASGTQNVTFSNITFNGDDNGGGVTVSSGTVTFTGCTFNRCDTSGSGGGVEITDGTVVFTSPTFSSCNAGTRGGALSVSGGSATLTGASFSNCTASDYGGAVSVNGGTASITGTFNKNSSYSGGAVSVTGGSITLSEASFTDNDATNNGGAIYSSSGLTLGANVTFNTISDSAPNKATNGGALYIASGTSNISGSRVEFTENRAEYGGGIYIASGTVNVTGESITFSGNTVSEDGGAIWAGSGSRVNLTGSSLSISNNQATSGDGGGIYASGNSTVTLEATSLGSNQAEIGRGGAVFMAGGSTLNVSGAVSLASNRANFGGAIYMANARNSTNLNINGTDAVTFTDNDAQTSGGGIYAEANCVITLEPELTFTGNYARNGNGGALWVTDASQLPEGTVVFSGNHAVKVSSTSTVEGSGGAIYVQGSATSSAIIGPVRIYSFEGNNTAMSYGGGICSNSGDITFEGYTGDKAITTVNTAYLGGGLAASYTGTMRFNNCTITNQVATRGSGGAVWAKNVAVNSCDFGAEGSPNQSQGTGNSNGGGAIYSNGSMTLSNATFSFNEAVQGGGAVYADTASVNIRNSYFHDNHAQGGNGGAVNLRNYCTTAISSTTFTENESENLDGGAVYAQGSIEISYCYFTLNQSKRSGGAIYFDQTPTQEPYSSFTIRNSMLTENSTQGGTEGGNGGGIFIASNRATVTSCTFNKNHLDLAGNSGAGGGIYLNTSTYQTSVNRIENCTFYENAVNDGASPNSDNTIFSGGGGIAVLCEGRTEIVSCTFAGNGSRYKGGGIYIGAVDGTVSVAGTMAVGNTSLGTYDIWSDGNISSGGYNRVGVYGTGSGVTDFYSETRNETDRTSYPSKGWKKSTFFSSNVLAENPREDLGGDIPPSVGSARAGQVKLLTLMLSEDATLPLTDRATNIIPYSRRTSFPDTDERGVSRTAGGEDVALDVGACFFDGTRYSPRPSPVAVYTLSRIEISGIPNNLRRVGQTASLIAKVYYTNGRSVLGGSGENEEPVIWTSDKPNIIRINETTGDITVLNFTPGDTYVTITVKTERGDLSGRQLSDSKVIKVTEYTYSYLNTSDELLDYLQGYTEQLTEYDITLQLADRNPSSVTSSAFQASFASLWGGVSASQVTNVNESALRFDTSKAYSSSDGYSLPEGKAGVGINFTGLKAGDLFPLTYTWSFKGSELREILGYDLSGRTINADEIFSTMRVDFQGTGTSWPVVGSGGVRASEAISSGMLKLTKTDGDSGLKVEMTAYLANVTSSGNSDGPQIVNGLLIVPDGNGNDGRISGTMWLADKAGNASNGNSTPSNGNGDADTNSSSGGGGGCNALGILPILAVMLLRRKG
ncbi:MAG: hypothetical protein IJQ70_09370 [Synergistaceae bacterium]|nr:hypothetical protein [Synergistaceae bacterium]